MEQPELHNDSPTVPDNLPEDPSISYNPYRTEVHTSDLENAARIPSSKFDMETAEIKPGDKKPRVEPAKPPKENYRYITRIGHGGHGDVWEAVQENMHRIVAVKMLREEIFAESRKDETTSKRMEIAFRREAITTGSLDHPNIAPVHEYGIDSEGRPMLAMKRVRGTPWDKMLYDDFILPMEEFLARHLPILMAMGQATAFAHSRGIVHRDLKPSQVMVGGYGEVLLMDWGLAVTYDLDLARQEIPHLVEEDFAPGISDALNPAGTVAFMAPEQTLKTSKHIGPWTDVYLLGGTLYYMLAGVPPHFAPDTKATFLRARTGIVEPPQNRAKNNRHIPEELSEICLKAMAAEPEERFDSADEFVNAVRDYIGGAGRRRESIAICDEVSERLDTKNSTYGDFASTHEMLTRALTLWPGNDRANSQRDLALTDHARLAMANGDLVLAKVQAQLLPNSPHRQSLVQEIDRLEQASTARERQRRTAKTFMYAFFILLIVSVAGWWNYRIQSQAELTSLRLESEEQRHEVEKKQYLADHLTALNSLYSDERALADQLLQRLPVPRELEHSLRDTAIEIPEAEARGLLGRVAILRERRKALAAETEVPLDAEPYGLALGHANFAFHSASNQIEFLSAYDLYRNAGTQRPDLPEAVRGMGIAAFRAGFPSTATLHLHDATELEAKLAGTKSESYADALVLEAQALRDLSSSSPDVLQLYERSFEILEPYWATVSLKLAEQYLELGKLDRAEELTSGTLQWIDRQTLDPENSEVDYETLRTSIIAEITRAAILIQRGDAAGAVELLLALKHRAETELPGDKPIQWMVVSHLALAYEYAGRPRDARPEYLKTHELLIELYGPEDFRVISSISNMASNLRSLGDLEESERLHSESMELAKKVLGADHPETIRQMNNFGGVLYELGRVDEAKDLFQRVLKSRVNTFGPNSPYTADAYNNLGGIYYVTGDLARALEYFEESYKRRAIISGADHPDTIRIQNNLAMLYLRKGDNNKALTTMEAIHGQNLKLHGPDAYQTGRSHSSLGSVLTEVGRYDEAIEHFLSALAIMTESSGANSPRTLAVRLNLASIYRLQGRQRDALEELKILLKAHQATYAEPHSSTGEVENQIALVYQALEQSEKAMEHFEEARRIYESVYGLNHPDVARMKMNIGGMLLNFERLEEAETYTREAAEVLEATLGPLNSATSQSLLNLAAILSKRERFEEAEEYVRQVLAMREENLAPDNPDLAKAYHTLGTVLHEKEDHRGSEEALLKALEIWQLSLPAEHLSILRTRVDLGQNYIRSDRIAQGLGEFADVREIAAANATPGSATERYLPYLDAQIANALVVIGRSKDSLKFLSSSFQGRARLEGLEERKGLTDLEGRYASTSGLGGPEEAAAAMEETEVDDEMLLEILRGNPEIESE